MDRIETMKTFVAALDAGSLAGAGRKLGRSPAAVSRAIAFLEDHVGAELLHRTTRSIKLSEAGERYSVACRQVLIDLEKADLIAAREQSAPRGTLTLTAPVHAGEAVVRPVLDAFMDVYPEISARLHLMDSPVNLIEEGIDVALQIANLPDSTLIAIKVGEVRRVVVAAPRYLARHAPVQAPADLARLRIISVASSGPESWSFPSVGGSPFSQPVQFAPRLLINTVRGALESAVEGGGVTRLLSHQVADHLRSGALEILLADFECPPLPVQLVMPHGRLCVPKVRAFVDFAVPRLRRHFIGLNEKLSAPAASA